MQLDRVPPPTKTQLDGTLSPYPGVETERCGGTSRGRKADWRLRLTATLMSFTLLGQGEQARIDPRFVRPDATLVAYWEALRQNDVEGVQECVYEFEDGLPFPGMLWFLPPTREFTLSSIRCVPIDAHRVVAAYEVRFRAIGMVEERRLPVVTELVLDRGEWRVRSALAETGVLELRPIPRSVDI